MNRLRGGAGEKTHWRRCVWSWIGCGWRWGNRRRFRFRCRVLVMVITMRKSLLLGVAAVFAVATFFISSLFAQSAACSLKTAGYLGGCDNIYLKWFDGRRDATSYRLAFADGAVVTVPGNRLDYSRLGVGCGWGGQVTITGFYSGGLVCSASYAGNLPHNRPCDQCVGVSGLLEVVSAANFRSALAPGAIATAFGVNLSTETQAARALPLPDLLAGVRVFVGETPAKLFYVSPTQINFELPPSLAPGYYQIRATNAAGVSFTGYAFLAEQAPAVFSVDRTGGGDAAADYLTFANDPGAVWVSLWVSGLRAPLAASECVLVLADGSRHLAQFAGPSPYFAGVWQLNFRLASRGKTGATLRVAAWESQGFFLFGR